MPRRDIGNPKYTRQCANPACGQEFQQRTSTQLVCSVQCRGWLVAQIRENSGGLRAKAGLEPRVCQNPACGREYVPVRGKQTACSLKCYRKTPARQQAQQEYDASRDRSAWQKEYDARPERQARQNQSRRGARNRKQALAKNGFSVEDYEAKLAAQGGVCALCGCEPKTGLRKDGGRMPAFHWDHDHETGVWRDLLCGNCNMGLGLFGDDPELLRAAAEYIERHRAVAGADGGGLGC